MKPFVVNGEAWRVVRVIPSDPSLIDRTGTLRIATTDPETKTISISSAVVPPLLDRVLLHEVAHAVTMSYGLLDSLRSVLPPEWWVLVEEWAVQLVELYSMEAVSFASESLGRPICVRGFCND